MAEATCESAPPTLPFGDRVRVGLETLLAELAAEPELARTAIVESQELDSPQFRPYRRVLIELTGLLETAVESGELEELPPERTAGAVTSSLITVVSSEIDAQRCETLPRLHPELVYFALVPYVGAEVAEKQMDRAREVAAEGYSGFSSPRR